MKKIFIIIGILFFVSSCSITIENTESNTKDLTKVHDNLYPNIIFDYQGVIEEKIIQDFGEPNSKSEASGYVDGTPWSDEHLYYNYPFDEGQISFYINKNTMMSDYVHVYLHENSNLKINIPGLVNKGDSYSDIVLGESTYNDLFKLINPDKEEIKNIISYEGGSLGNHYTQLELYFGNFGDYHNYIFNISGLYNENIEKDYTIIKDEVINELIIK